MTVDATADGLPRAEVRGRRPASDDAVQQFLDFLDRLRGCSELTIRSYGAALRGSRAFAESEVGRVLPSPHAKGNPALAFSRNNSYTVME